MTKAVQHGTRVYTALGYRVAFAISFVGGLVAAACAIVLHLRIRDEHRAANSSPGENKATTD